MMENVLKTKSYDFAIRIVKLSQHLREKKEYILSKQILRSGTAVGALIREAEYGQSKLDFVNKLSISLKQTSETEYWINLLKDTGYIDDKLFRSLEKDCKELLKLLIASIKTAKERNKKKDE
jgi:four helix bundle protein